jgi:hypothetical protein
MICLLSLKGLCCKFAFNRIELYGNPDLVLMIVVSFPNYDFAESAFMLRIICNY